METQYNEVNDECTRMMAEINELRRQIEEKEAINAQMDQNKKLRNQNIEELKRHLDDETRSKQTLSEQFQIQRPDSYLVLADSASKAYGKSTGNVNSNVKSLRIVLQREK